MATAEVEQETTTGVDELTPAGELYRIETARNDDGTIDVTVVDWERDGDEVEVEFELPTGDTTVECMDWPWPLDSNLDEYKFVRLCDRVGGVTMADELREGRVSVPAQFEGSRQNGSWTLTLPREKGAVERVRDRVTGIYSDTTGWKSAAGSLLFASFLVPIFPVGRGLTPRISLSLLRS